MTSERCKGNGLGNIPEWLLVEVLIRLPVKLVFKFKLVSKEWLSVISDPSFAQMYISRASMPPKLQPWTFISDTMRVNNSQSWGSPQNVLLLDIHSSDFLKHPSFYVLPCPSTEHPIGTWYIIVGVSNGLVLYGSRMPEEWRLCGIRRYGICNPITGQCITLSPHAQNFKVVSSGFLTRVENGILTSYGVVRLEVPIQKSNIIKFEVFLSEINEWKYFTVPIDQEIVVVHERVPTALNGILHWITRKHGIIAYDPYHNPEFLRFIALPGDIDLTCNDGNFSGIPSLCDVHQGRLRYFESPVSFVGPHGFSGLGVWILNDYSTGDWCMQHRVSSADIVYDGILSNQRDTSFYVEPISFHPFDSDIVFLGHENLIVSYNIKTRKLSAHVDYFVGQNTKLRSRPVWWKTFLLMIAPWPISIPCH